MQPMRVSWEEGKEGFVFHGFELSSFCKMLHTNYILSKDNLCLACLPKINDYIPLYPVAVFESNSKSCSVVAWWFCVAGRYLVFNGRQNFIHVRRTFLNMVKPILVSNLNETLKPLSLFSASRVTWVRESWGPCTHLLCIFQGLSCLLLFEGTGPQPPTFENCEKFQAKYCCPNLCDLDNSKMEKTFQRVSQAFCLVMALKKNHFEQSHNYCKIFLEVSVWGKKH